MKKFKFNKEGHYYELDGKRLYGITNILGVIAKPALIQWAANMATKYIEDNAPHPVGKDYQVSIMCLEEARYAHRRKKEDAGEKGHDVHADIEELILYAIANNKGAISGKSENPQVQHFIDWATTNNIKFLETEAQLYSEKLWIAGTADFLAEKDGKKFVGDIKTYGKIWDRVPFLQCAGYSLMLEERGHKIDSYCVIRLGKDGSFEEKWSFDIEGDRQGFLAALTLFKTLETWKIK